MPSSPSAPLLFESCFCNPTEAHEKGLVEGLVGYARRNWFVPTPEVANWQELNAYLADKCRAEGERRLRGATATMGELLAQEQVQFLPLPTYPFPCCRLQPARANGFGLVTFQTNRCSVPAPQAHEALWLRAFVDRVEITNGRETLAVHPRCYNREQDILNPLHYLPLLEQPACAGHADRRPGAWEQAQPIQEWRAHWPAVYDRYLAVLRQRLSRSQAVREFVRILQLHADYPEITIAEALEAALEGHCYSADGVKQLVLRLTEPTAAMAPLNGAGRPPRRDTGDLVSIGAVRPASQRGWRMSVDVRLPILLRQLRLPTVAANYRKLAQEAAEAGQPYEAYLLALLEQEADQRDINRRKRRVREARFPVLHTLDEFDFAAIPSLNRDKVLQLARGDYIERHENVALIGGIGTGKTHIATSLGLAACQQGRRVRFYTAAGLINALLEAQEDHQLSKLEKQLMRYDLIILDEVGFVPFSQRGAQMLFAFVSQKYLRGSLIVTSNLAFAEWTEVFGEANTTEYLTTRTVNPSDDC